MTIERTILMPELPEVETVRRGLTPVMEGAQIVKADIRRPDLRWPFPENMAARLTGQQVLALRRRSKYILADLSGGETLLIHLGMSGRFLITPPAGASEMPGVFVHNAGGPHDHVVLTMNSGHVITYNDPRRFGAMDLSRGDHKLLQNLGPEPLGNEFNAAHLAARFTGRKTTIKAALLDQRHVAGLGNIYVCEALHRAGICPKRAAGSISRPRLERLTTAIREVLNDAIAAGGSSLRDHRQTNGDLGYFQHNFAVYGREAAPCTIPGCNDAVQRIVQSGRSTFYCPQCQR
jgi:formamidopyrimidine-DNA glycosylase